MNMVLAAAGLTLHLTEPAQIAAVAKMKIPGPWGARSRITAQRHYDLATTSAAALALPAVIVDATWVSHPLLIPVWAGLAILLPCAVWWGSSRGIRVRRHSTVLSTLPAAAAGEEVLWRAAAPLLLAHWGIPSLASIAASAAVFIALHYRRNARTAGLAYIALFTTITWGAMVMSGLVAAIAVHIAHNLALALLEPIKDVGAGGGPPPLSQDIW